MIKIYGVPKEWKVPQYRWKCPRCKAEGWNNIKIVPRGHTRPDGRNCLQWDKQYTDKAPE